MSAKLTISRINDPAIFLGAAMDAAGRVLIAMFGAIIMSRRSRPSPDASIRRRQALPVDIAPLPKLMALLLQPVWANRVEPPVLLRRTVDPLSFWITGHDIMISPQPYLHVLSSSISFVTNMPPSTFLNYPGLSRLTEHRQGTGTFTRWIAAEPQLPMELCLSTRWDWSSLHHVYTESNKAFTSCMLWACSTGNYRTDTYDQSTTLLECVGTWGGHREQCLLGSFSPIPRLHLYLLIAWPPDSPLSAFAFEYAVRPLHGLLSIFVLRAAEYMVMMVESLSLPPLVKLQANLPSRTSSWAPFVDLQSLPPLPPKRGFRGYRWLRWNFGSVYRRLFSLVFSINMAALLWFLMSTGKGNAKMFTFQACIKAVSANLLVALLCRNEHVVNALFLLFGTWPRRAPLFLRRLFAKVYSYGGIHSACGVAATAWYIGYLIQLTRDDSTAISPSVLHAWLLRLSYFTVAPLIAILIFATPRLRVIAHDWFESSHRFMGWLIVLMFWAQTMLLAAEASQMKRIPLAIALVLDPGFWMLAVISLLVVYPWTHLRLRDVEAVKLSDHVIELKFDYANVHYGQVVRLSDAPLWETHAFAVIPHAAAIQIEAPAPDAENTPPPDEIRTWPDDRERLKATGTVTKLLDVSKSEGGEHVAGPARSKGSKEGFSVLVSNAGDWTSKIIKSQPSQIWTRGVPQYGMLRVAGLFEAVLIVATGSGIGPCLSLFIQKPDHPVRIIWSARSPTKNYGQGVVDTILRTDPRAVIHDTSQDGRPDLTTLACRIWQSSRRESSTFTNFSNYDGIDGGKLTKPCEAVVILSNQKVTQKVVYGLESRGIPAYGAIFDS